MTEVIGAPYTDTTLWKIAWDDEVVAGQVKSFIDAAQNEEHGRERGWTRRSRASGRWRRARSTKALIVESIRELAARGITEVALGMHTESPNGAYESMPGSATRSPRRGRPTASRSDGSGRLRWAISSRRGRTEGGHPKTEPTTHAQPTTTHHPHPPPSSQNTTEPASRRRHESAIPS